MKELICIMCPKGCRLQVDEENGYKVTGNTCEKGAVYGKNELQNPTRVITSTVKIDSASHRRLPVKTNGEIAKAEIMEATALLDHVTVKAPIRCGDTVLANVLNTGVDFVSTKTVLE